MGIVKILVFALSSCCFVGGAYSICYVINHLKADHGHKVALLSICTVVLALGMLLALAGFTT